MRIKIVLTILLLSITINASSQIRDLIIGNWVFKDAYNKEKIDKAGLEMLNSEVINKMSFNFKSNGKLKAFIMGEKKGGKWELTKNNDGIKLFISGEQVVKLTILKLTKTELGLKLGLGEFLMKRGKGKSRRKKLSKEKKVLEKNPNKNIDIKKSELVSFELIKEIPTTTDCNSSLNDKKLRECVKTSISSHVRKKFNAMIAGNLGLAPKRHQIITTFIITTNGEIVNVKSKSEHPKLSQEASRVLSILPNMKPGKLNGIVVNVKYTYTIKFNVE